MTQDRPHLLAAFGTAVQAHADRVAIVEPGGQAVTFAELDRRVTGFAAHWSRQGLRAGDRLLLAMPVCADLYAALAALWSLGATAVLPEPAMGLRGVRYALQLAPCQGVVASGPYIWLKALLPGLWRKPLYRPCLGEGAAPVRPSEVALISFTSGSTGLPKAIARSHRFLMAQEAAIAPLLRSDRPERDLVAFPVFTLLNLAAGRSSVLPDWRMSRLDRVTPQALAGWISAQQVTRALLPPALCETLAKAPALPLLRHVFTGGGPVFPDAVAALKQAQPGLEVTAVYGSTEAEPIAHLDAADVSPGDLKTMRSGGGLLAGRPVPEVQLRLHRDEILVAGEHVNRGYLDASRDAESKLRDGDTVWHRTGDAGRLDEAGRLWLLGRHSGDGPPYPFQIEVAARSWPGVRRAAFLRLRLGGGVGDILAIEGNPQNLPDWRRQAEALGPMDVRPVPKLPMDRRHRSKIDQSALRRLLGA